MPEKVVPPSRREIVASAAISVAVTVVAGCVVTILVGFPAFWVDLAMTDPTADASTPTGLPEWAVRALFVVVLAILWPISCRLGEGTWGDSMMELKALTPVGEPAGRGRVWARTGVLLAVLAAATVLRRPGAGVLLIVLQWFLALVRADRRSVVDLVVGVAPHTTASPKLGKPLLWPPPSA